MKLIRIDHDVWDFLQKHAVPLEDNPNSVLRRLLRVDQPKARNRGKTSRRKRLARGSGRTEQETFLKPILKVLVQLGGKAETKEALKRLEHEMKGRLTAVDFENLKTGQVRWKNTAQWARNELVAEDYLAKNTPRGIWQITEKGRDFLKAELV